MLVFHRRASVTRLATVLAAIGVSIALVLGQAGLAAVGSMVGLVNTVIGIGGSSDPVSERLPAKLNQTVVPPGDTYIGTEYPASLNLDHSVRIGMPVLHQHLVTTSGKVLVAGYSLGALLVEQLKRDIAGSSNPPSPLDLSFLQIATPFVPNGGIFARFPGFFIPNVVSAMGPTQPTPYNTTYVVNEYDTWGDFPAYFNPVSLLNAVLGHNYAHVDAHYDAVDPTAEANHVKEVQNSAGGFDTYVLVPTSHLPLLGPLRDIADRLGLTPVSERLLGLVEPLLRVIVDMTYTDRLNLNPEVRNPFSLITPPHKIIEALNAVPGAVREGLENLLGVQRAPVTPAEAPPAPTLRSVTGRAAQADARQDTVEFEAPEKKLGATPSEMSEDELEGDTAPPTTVEKPSGGGTVTTMPRDPSPKPTSSTEPTADTSDSEAVTSPRDQDSRDDGAEAA